MAAVIGSRLLVHILNSIEVSRVVLWSNSQIVLNWLNSNKALKPFIANRVREIGELTDAFTWKYCPTDSNRTDLLSRGISAYKFRDNGLWMNGPKWLTTEDEWPQWKIDETCILSTIAEHEEELTNNSVNVTNSMCTQKGIRNAIEIDRFSSLKSLLRVTVYVKRFISNCKSQERLTGTLTTSEIQHASTIWIQDAQERHFPDVFKELQLGSKKHNLVKLPKLYLDKYNMIQCEGHIHNAELDDTTKFPLLLPGKDKLTQLIIMDAHISQTYWIPAIRQVVKNMLSKCVNCRKVIGQAYSAPDSPPLPKDRLREAPPFTVTEVDFSGALTVKNKDGKSKFRRFASRKSLPKVMISDNATTYVAAAKQIEELTRSPLLVEKLNNYGTVWKFIPKQAPWYGGWWERLIGLTQDCIKKTLGFTH